MNKIDLLAIHRKTGLTDRKINRQLHHGAVLHAGHPLNEQDEYPIEIAGPAGTYTLRCAGARSIHAILDHFEELQARIDAGHEEQVRQRLADIDRQLENLPRTGERAYQADKALGEAWIRTARSEPLKWRR